MSVRNAFAVARVRNFADAGEAYVTRVRDRATDERRPARADRLRRLVLRRLATAERRQLLYRFAHFFSLTHFAGIDPLALCWEPPVLTAEARRRFAGAAPDWVGADDALRDPNDPEGHRIYLGAVPELCCFGAIAVEVLPGDMLRWTSLPAGGNAAAYARTLNADLTNAVSRLAAGSTLTDHDARVLFELLERLEQIAGTDFSLPVVTDGQVLDLWTSTAAAKGPTRFASILRQLAALAAELSTVEAEQAGRQTASFDDPSFVEPLHDQARILADSDWIEHALSDGFLADLLSREELGAIEQQLSALGSRPGLFLSRARLLTFGGTENLVINAKRQQRDPATIAREAARGTSYPATLAMLATLAGKLDRFLDASLHLLWDRGRHADALRIAVLAGRLSRADVAAWAPDLHGGADDDFTARVEAALAGVQRTGELDGTLHAGRVAWLALSRRKAFAAPGTDDGTIDRMEDGAALAARLRHAVTRLHGNIAAAVADRREDTAFAAERDLFCAALARVHGFASPSRESHEME
jgi:hypothetical protein